MPKIQQLSPHVADLIAAGEVVERPGSVIKELIENSIDAGATMLTVEIKNGGMTYMRVTDNGCGISPEDAPTAFLRHATSKLRDARGLECIKTLGFRGEALAAIAAVSRVTLKTCERGANEGTEVRLSGGEVTFCGPCGCPEGTTMVVEDLFYNTPARLKFMKSDRAEGLNVSAVVLRCAMSHPEVSVKYIKDGKEECHTAGDGRVDSCIYTLLGRETGAGMINAETTDGTVSVSGCISTPEGCRGNRTHQFFFVNGRFVKSKLLQAALEQAYKNSLFTGRYPACVLYITLPEHEVDVNVHPTKTEVRFLHEKQVFDGVYYAALSALGGKPKTEEKPAAPAEKLENPPLRAHIGVPSGGFKSEPAKSTYGGGFKTVSADSFRKSTAYGASGGFKTSVPAMSDGAAKSFVHNETRTPYQTKFDAAKAGSVQPKPEPQKFEPAQTALDIPKSEPAHEEITLFKSEPVPESFFPPVEDDWRMVGEVLATYIVVERGDSVFFIDKHAAHERMNFDRLKKQAAEPMTQQLLYPVICRLGAEDMVVFEENIDFLRSLGFEADVFGESSAAVRAVPEDIDAANVPDALSEICEKLRQGRYDDIETRRDAALRTIACKASIKAGKLSEPEELRLLCRKVLSGEVRTCPHGRPVLMELTRTQIDRGFKRI